LYYNIDTGRCTEEERASTFEETNNNNEPF